MKRDYLRWHVLERDSYACIFCDARASDLHHVIPRSQGGTNYPDNLISVCRCHHMVLHGNTIPGIDWTREELQQAAVEYVCDYYADTWRGWSGKEVFWRG